MNLCSVQWISLHYRKQGSLYVALDDAVLVVALCRARCYVSA
jgi:hypothetical protein